MQATKKTEEYKWFWDNLDQFLAKKQLKQTKQRRIVVEHFLALNQHVDAEQLHKNLKGEGFQIGLATVYRTLSLLKEAGLVEQKSFNDGRSVFEIDHPHEHHDHLICLDCGHVVEFENQKIEHLQHQVAKELGFELQSHRLDLFGHCQQSNCSYRKPIT